MLSLRELGDDLYDTAIPGSGYLFGGCTVSCALVAAGRTAPGFAPKSVQAHFLRSGEWGRRASFRVARWPDTRSFASRTVTVVQEDRVLAVVSASLHRPEEGPSWQRAAPPPVPPPDELAPTPVHLPVPLMEVRRVETSASVQHSWHPYWARCGAPIGEDQTTHAAAIAFMSDYVVIFSLHDARPAVAPTDTIRTINHALWFHRPLCADRWHLFSSEPQSVSAGRGLTLGTVFDEDGALVASFVQETVIRPPAA